MGDLSNKVALITGASYGVGRALAIGLARENCDLILVARGKEGLEETASSIKAYNRRVFVLPTDITDIEQVHSMAEKVMTEFGKIDILWNGASSFSDQSLSEISEDDLGLLIDTTVKGTLFVTKTLLPLLKVSGNGHIVNIVSDWALPGAKGPAPFTAAKYAVAGMGNSLKVEVLSEGVKTTNIYAGDIASTFDLDTDMDTIRDEHGSSMISLRDIVNIVILVLKMDMAWIPSISILPLDPEYSS